MNEITVAARLERLDFVLQFLDTQLNKYRCPEKEKVQIALAAEEVYVNIAQYAYSSGEGNATIRFSAKYDPLQFTIQFLDSGRPYNPLAAPDPDISLSAEERGIGGLGILIVKKSMDTVYYEFQNGKNIFTMIKAVMMSSAI